MVVALAWLLFASAACLGNGDGMALVTVLPATVICGFLEPQIQRH